MAAIFKKEFNAFFGNLSGFLAIGLFLLFMGLLLFVFPQTSILDYGYATLDKFFETAPWVLLLLVPAVTMRSFSDEYKTGTWEILSTRPVRNSQVVIAKFLGAFSIVLLAILPTLVYWLTIKLLSINGSTDTGAILGSYTGLIFLAATFTAIGLWCSSLSSNSIAAFLLAAFLCFFMYKGFAALASIPALSGGADYWLGMIGIEDHYMNVSRGLLTLHDLVYFLVLPAFFLFLTMKKTSNRA